MRKTLLEQVEELRRQGARRLAAVRRQQQERPQPQSSPFLPTRPATENVSQRTQSDSGERPGALPDAPGILVLLLACLLSGCASVGGGVGDVHAALSVRRSASDREATAQPPTSPRTEELPVCGFEAPYLPDPCRLEVTPGEWLRISNPKPKETKKHGWLWWLLISLVTI